MFFGLLSAAGYTAANIFLRQLAEEADHAWVSCVKAWPTALVALAILARERRKGAEVWPALRVVCGLLAVGTFMQLGGNVSFQFALANVGLAVTVPLVFGSLILTGALAGRVWLGEPVTKKTGLAMLSLVAAVTLLSVGAERIGETGRGLVPAEAASWLVTLAIGAGCLAGFSYALCNVVIRRVTQRGLPYYTPLFLFSLAGVVGLGVLAAVRLGPVALLNTTPTHWTWMLLAGLFNGIAFFSLAHSLRAIPVVQANALNSTQVAMCAAIGVALFDEPLTGWLSLGIALTIAGVMLSGRGKTVASRVAKSKERQAPRALPGARPSPVGLSQGKE